MIREKSSLIIEKKIENKTSGVTSMKNNDLSNRGAFEIAFRVEDFLLKYKDGSTFDKIANLVVGKVKRAEFDPKVLSAINKIFKGTDMTICLIVDTENDTRQMRAVLDNLPGRVVPIDKLVQVAIMLHLGDIAYYVDEDVERVSQVGHKNCISLESLNHMIR